MIEEILKETIIRFLKILPIIIIAVIVSQFLIIHIKKNKIKKYFKETEKNIAEVSAVGILTPGPMVAFLPILKTFKEKGLPISLIIAFITGQALIGPGRMFLEISYFGIWFFVYRVLIAFLIAIGVGTSFRIIERYIKF